MNSDNGKMLMLAPPSMSMCPISIPSRCPRMKRGFMCAPGFSGFLNATRYAPNSNSVTSFVGARNFAGIMRTMLTSIGTDSSPCWSFSSPGLLLPESGLGLPDSGWQFPDSGLQLPNYGFPSPDPELSSPLVGVTMLASSPLLSPLLPPSSLANHFPATFASAWSWAVNG
jgi:hypothetical protein